MMNFHIIEESYIDDGSKVYLISIATEHQIYLSYILESLEGWCSHTMVKKNEPLLQFTVVPDFIDDFDEILEFLRNWDLD